MSCVIVNKSNLNSKELVEKLFANEKVEDKGKINGFHKVFSTPKR